jgi:hypothetical protein
MQISLCRQDDNELVIVTRRIKSPGGTQTFMRYISKAFAVAVGLLAIGLLSSPVPAADVLAGKFTLLHPTRWNDTVLPAGDYTFRVARTMTNADVLKVRGTNQTIDLFIFNESACEICRSASLNLAIRDDNRVVTSLELPGFHVNFKARQSAAQKREELAKTPSPSEQVAVHIN